jgi:hypothetical protein
MQQIENQPSHKPTALEKVVIKKLLILNLKIVTDKT